MKVKAQVQVELALAVTVALGWAVAGHAADPHAGHAGHQAAAPAPAAAPAAPAGALKATLTGANEVPGPGDADGSGAATVAVDMAKSQICYTLTVANVEGVTMAHIHKAPMGSMGNVVLPLTAPTTGASEGCVQIKPELGAAILASPGDFYVNVHSEANIAGAVRGQLGK